MEVHNRYQCIYYILLQRHNIHSLNRYVNAFNCIMYYKVCGLIVEYTSSAPPHYIHVHVIVLHKLQLPPSTSFDVRAN